LSCASGSIIARGALCSRPPGCEPTFKWNAAVESSYYGRVIDIPESYPLRRSSLGFDAVPYGVGGIELYQVGELEGAQTGYSVDTEGRSLTGSDPGDWSSDWIVFGFETACGDPIFLSSGQPHSVFTAMHGEGDWSPDVVAPSIEKFWDCLEIFRGFAAGRGSPGELEANPPNDTEIEAYLQALLRCCDGDPAAVAFWAAQAEIGMDDERWQLRLERLLATGELS
jgi:hypothetical protein